MPGGCGCPDGVGASGEGTGVGEGKGGCSISEEDFICEGTGKYASSSSPPVSLSNLSTGTAFLFFITLFFIVFLGLLTLS